MFNFSSMAAGKKIEWLSLDTIVQQGADDCYYIRVEGNNFEPFIYDGDLLVVEPSCSPLNGDLIIAEINGGKTIKEFKVERNGLYLVTHNPKPKSVMKENILGVIVYIVHKTRLFEMQNFRGKEWAKQSN